MRAGALPKLEVIHLQRTRLTNRGAVAIFDALGEVAHLNMRDINFAECDGIGDEAMLSLVANLKRTWENPLVQDLAFTKIDLSGTMDQRHHVSDVGLCALANALLERDFFLNHLEELNLSDNDIADEGLRALAAALGDGHLRKMTSLYLSANKITNEGAFALAAAAKGAKKLPELYDMRLDYQLVGWDGRRAIVEAFKERGQKVSVILKNLE